jgi:Flp pilus assembly protein TadG
MRRRQRAQALVETALAAPIILLLALGLVAGTRVTQAQMGVMAVAREAARAGALASSPATAATQGFSRGQQVAAGYGLAASALGLNVDASGFSRGGQVRAVASYTVQLADIPLFGVAQVPLSSQHVEVVDPYRALPDGGAL